MCVCEKKERDVSVLIEFVTCLLVEKILKCFVVDKVLTLTGV